MENPHHLRLVRPPDEGDESHEDSGVLGKGKEHNPAEVLDRAVHIRRFIGDMEGSISKNTIADQEQIVKDYSVSELQFRILNSGESDWKTKPAFYIALCDRYYSIVKESRQ